MHAKRWLELLGLFILLPLCFWAGLHQFGPYLLIVLACVSGICLWLLVADQSFRRVRLWNWQAGKPHLLASLKLFLPWALITAAVVYWWLPESFLQWPVEHTSLWLLTLLLYPLLSVIPQEIIYRTFFFHRYKSILPTHTQRLGASTMLFGFAHAIYGNWLAVALSAVGGAIFGVRYLQSRSTAVVVIEHSLWGCFLFTIGLGSYLSLQHTT
ncbi:CPBP family intramembrane glutamic endopeptidase [Alteromonas gilva]|uniref:CPBP family intramembrane metalloprotease n=1 Tax=Alteromonas gilva TaxID=2987522 RepID=A0ABT5L313_9ALTE|nr:CPBP family intramembrane glutamic endopeptidase [Alteromonas gilva]MDC8831435.1 CPBP family intramembrane metalloprotease [Alteromonas gilva]